jgi:hypothetical protein
LEPEWIAKPAKEEKIMNESEKKKYVENKF